MIAQIYNIAATTVNTILMNPLIPFVLMVVVLAIVTGLAGRVAIRLEDLHHNRIHSRAAVTLVHSGWGGTRRHAKEVRDNCDSGWDTVPAPYAVITTD
jgi:hypothetical protein